MIIKVIRERAGNEITIDTAKCQYPWALREAIELALSLDGYSQDMINEVFGIMPDVVEENNLNK